MELIIIFSETGGVQLFFFGFVFFGVVFGGVVFGGVVFGGVVFGGDLQKEMQLRQIQVRIN